MRVEEEDEEVSGITGSMVRALPFALPFAKSSDDPNIASGCGEIQSSQSILSQWRRSTHPINRPSGMGHGTDAAEAAAFTTAASTAAASNASASTTANAADAAPTRGTECAREHDAIDPLPHRQQRHRAVRGLHLRVSARPAGAL